jgi:hypothetical protein
MSTPLKNVLWWADEHADEGGKKRSDPGAQWRRASLA